MKLLNSINQTLKRSPGVAVGYSLIITLPIVILQFLAFWVQWHTVPLGLRLLAILVALVGGFLLLFCLYLYYRSIFHLGNTVPMNTPTRWKQIGLAVFALIHLKGTGFYFELLFVFVPELISPSPPRPWMS